MLRSPERMSRNEAELTQRRPDKCRTGSFTFAVAEGDQVLNALVNLDSCITENGTRPKVLRITGLPVARPVAQAIATVACLLQKQFQTMNRHP